METKRKKKGIFTRKMLCLLSAYIALCICSSVPASWRPAKGPLMTRWAKKVSPNKVHPEYPRPQMVRKNWLNLNGLWEYAIQPKDEPKPAKFDGQILVPFAAESALSAVKKAVGEENCLWYRRTFEIPKKWKGQRILLHFGAVDWDTTVWVNGKQVGSRRGGYDPFSFDITDVLKRKGPQQIVLSVWDPTNIGNQPRGKQVKNPHGIWYTAVTGIWQTVWLEPVPKVYIKSLTIVPDIDAKLVRLNVTCPDAPASYYVQAEAKAGWFRTAKGRAKPGQQIFLPIENPKLWSPDSPFLYDLKITLHDSQGQEVDTVSSYFGMRKISLGKDENGVTRLFLNNKPQFMFGPLDQGWWPDGLYTAPTDQALAYDIKVLKRLGCNMLRKHVKVEPARLYYWCDKLGLMVWQDMPNGNNKTGEAREQFELELKRVIDSFRNHPCIIMWVIFNEGWGQYDTERLTAWVKDYDPTRLVNQASGWADKGVGDVHDIHKYPGPAAPAAEENRAIVLGEFGGLGLPVKGHTWQSEGSWGYRRFKTSKELTNAYLALLMKLRPLIGAGLSAAVYTQTTDVEIEVNGFMTYDRAIIKMDEKKATAANRRLYLPPPVIKTMVPTSQNEGQNWRYTTSKPADGWQKENFNDSSWRKGKAGFGTKGTPGAIVRTEWKTSDIWLRRTFQLKDTQFQQPHLLVHHDEDVQVYINGQLVADLKGYTTDYIQVPIAKNVLKVGRNCLSGHCHQTTGGQYIDVGLVEVIEQIKGCSHKAHH